VKYAEIARILAEKWRRNGDGGLLPGVAAYSLSGEIKVESDAP
jgi:hypothetical protein